MPTAIGSLIIVIKQEGKNGFCSHHVVIATIVVMNNIFQRSIIIHMSEP
jgi:hypothetical protein